MGFWDIAAQYGLPFAMLLTALITGARGDWIWGREAREKDARIKDLERRLDRALSIGERGTGLADRAAGIVEQEFDRTRG